MDGHESPQVEWGVAGEVEFFTSVVAKWIGGGEWPWILNVDHESSRWVPVRINNDLDY